MPRPVQPYARSLSTRDAISISSPDPAYATQRDHRQHRYYETPKQSQQRERGRERPSSESHGQVIHRVFNLNP